MQDFYNGGRTNNSFEGDFILNPNTRHNKYQCSIDGDVEIRVVPSFTNGVPDPLITGTEPGAASISDAIIRVGIVTFWGKNRYAMIDPAPPAGERRGPLSYFHQYIVDYVKNNPRTCPPDWRRWQGMKEEGDYQVPKRILSAPQMTLMVQGLLFTFKGNRILDKNGNPTCRWPVVVAIKPSGAKDLLDKLYEPMDINAPWGEDNNKLGNITDINRGCMLKISPYENVRNNIKQTWYRCSVGECTPITLESAKQVWSPWRDVLNFDMSISQCMEKIAETFDASSVVKVFEGSPAYAQLIPQSVWNAKAREEGITVNHIPEATPVMPQTPVYNQAPQMSQAAQMPQMPHIPNMPQMPQVPPVASKVAEEPKPTLESVFPAQRAPISLGSMPEPTPEMDSEEEYDEQLFPGVPPTPTAPAAPTGVSRLDALRSRIQK